MHRQLQIRLTVSREIYIKCIIINFIFQLERKPPDHMSIVHGPIKSRNLKKSTEYSNFKSIECLICSRFITNSTSKLCCLNSNCELVSHISCLADLFLNSGDYIPVEGSCPFCNMKMKWGDLIRKMKGCHDSSSVDDIDEERFISDEENVCSQDKGFVDNNSRWLVDNDDDL